MSWVLQRRRQQGYKEDLKNKEPKRLCLFLLKQQTMPVPAADLTTTSHSESIESDTVNSGPGCSRRNTVDNPINRATDVEGKTKIALPKGFCNKDGGNIIHVSTASLKHRYMDVWYELPNTLKQKLSNSFILSMCQSMEAKFRNIRQLTDWARKEREQRLKILFALHPLDEDLGRESNFLKKKNLKYRLSKLQEKYPIVSKADAHSSQEKFTINTKVDGDAFCIYHSDLRTIVKEAEDITKNCKTLLASCLKGTVIKDFSAEMYSFYEDVIKKFEAFLKVLTCHFEKVADILTEYRARIKETKMERTQMIKTKVNKRKQARTNETASIKKKKVAGAGEKSVEMFKGTEDKSKSEKMSVSDTESDNLNGTNFEKNELFKESGEQGELPAKSDKKKI